MRRSARDHRVSGEGLPLDLRERQDRFLGALLGDDADTTAAVTGQIAGVFYGMSGIPAHWLERLALREAIEALARGLHEAR